MHVASTETQGCDRRAFLSVCRGPKNRLQSMGHRHETSGPFLHPGAFLGGHRRDRFCVMQYPGIAVRATALGFFGGASPGGHSSIVRCTVGDLRDTARAAAPRDGYLGSHACQFPSQPAVGGGCRKRLPGDAGAIGQSIHRSVRLRRCHGCHVYAAASRSDVLGESPRKRTDFAKPACLRAGSLRHGFSASGLRKHGTRQDSSALR